MRRRFACLKLGAHFLNLRCPEPFRIEFRKGYLSYLGKSWNRRLALRRVCNPQRNHCRLSLRPEYDITLYVITRSPKAAIPAKVQPHGLLQSGRRCVETSDDVIEEVFTIIAAICRAYLRSATPPKTNQTGKAIFPATLHGKFAPVRSRD